MVLRSTWTTFARLPILAHPGQSFTRSFTLAPNTVLSAELCHGFALLIVKAYHLSLRQ